ncbi:MAG: alpha/beta hydrolase, partial [Gammaproteobacteria bacterium]|nr:alpha/beta hydrolase [Gammaproteobacteria bacterium]
HSDRPPEPYTTLHDFAQAVVWLMDGLGLERSSVYGLLTGSEIAVEVAAGWPERVEKLVLEEVFNWNTPSRRAVHERIHHYFPEQRDGS